nr:hypothetical protein [Nanchangia anserum]
MCRAVTCKVCKKTTWAGCGQHVAEVKRHVPPEQWCDGRHTEAEKANAAGSGFFSKLFGR